MATAEAYDDFDDPGLAFTDEQVKEYRPQIVASVRVNWLLEHIPLVLRRSQLGEKAQWWTKVGHKMVDVVTWYCVVAELPGIDREELMKEPEAEKALTLAARKLGEPDEFLAEWASLIRTEMVQHVTLGRRCSSARAISSWGKRERSISNKVANALKKELDATGRLGSVLASRTASKKGEE